VTEGIGLLYRYRCVAYRAVYTLYVIDAGGDAVGCVNVNSEEPAGWEAVALRVQWEKRPKSCMRDGSPVASFSAARLRANWL